MASDERQTRKPWDGGLASPKSASDERAASLGLGVWHGEGYYKGINLDELRSLLAAQGLHVVTDADMRVLEALSGDLGPSDSYLQSIATGMTGPLRHLARAELARRESTK